MSPASASKDCTLLQRLCYAYISLSTVLTMLLLQISTPLDKVLLIVTWLIRVFLARALKPC
jgi:hypothetical protein